MTDPSALVAEARRELARFPDLLDAMLAGLDADGWRARPAPDEWAPVEIVCHLRDEEAEDFGARVRACWRAATSSRRSTPSDGRSSDGTARPIPAPRWPPSDGSAENLALLADARARP